MITGRSRVFAILGDPVAHSLSPRMQNAAFRVLGLSAVYVPLSCAADQLTPLLRGIARAGGGGNVTVPHKETAASAVDLCRPLADSVEACNTFWSEDGQVIGDNTDVPGLLDALHQLNVPALPWFIAWHWRRGQSSRDRRRRSGRGSRDRIARRRTAAPVFGMGHGTGCLPRPSGRVWRTHQCHAAWVSPSDPWPIQPESFPALESPSIWSAR